MAGARGSGGHPRGGPRRADAVLRDRAAHSTVAPPGLSKAQLSYWQFYARHLKRERLWTVRARDVLRCYVEALELRDRLQAELATASLVTGDGQDGLKAHPLLAPWTRVILACRSYANDLCLAPAAAVRLPAASETPTRRDPAREFFGGLRAV